MNQFRLPLALIHDRKFNIEIEKSTLYSHHQQLSQNNNNFRRFLIYNIFCLFVQVGSVLCSLWLKFLVLVLCVAIWSSGFGILDCFDYVIPITKRSPLPLANSAPLRVHTATLLFLSFLTKMPIPNSLLLLMSLPRLVWHLLDSSLSSRCQFHSDTDIFPFVSWQE